MKTNNNKKKMYKIYKKILKNNLKKKKYKN